MNIKAVRFLNIIFITIMIIAGKYNFLWYIFAMHASLEILNRRKLYFQHVYKFYNFISWAYGLVLLERLRVSHFSESTEWLINCAEHLLFGIIICINVYIYTTVFTKTNTLTRWHRGFIAFTIFNFIGLFNEIFQNSMNNRNLFVLIPDSIKDIEMNLLGATVFLIAVFCKIGWLRKTMR
ncbi:MAG: hypothetical protein ABI402_05370 [Ferruginibacter sp.]